MLTRSNIAMLTLACGLLLATGVANAQLDLYVPGAFTNAAGLGADWTPATAPPMTETSPGSGIYELEFDFDYGTNGDLSGTRYGFKILSNEDGGAVTWDDVQITPEDSWFVADADGMMTITLDTNTYADDFTPDTNRVIIADDIATWNAVGNFMDEAGGTVDWDNGDAAFTMADQGSGLYSLTAIISTPGAYEWRAVQTGEWVGIGTDQRRDNAANMGFNTFEIDQEVTFEVDTAKGGIRFSTAAVLAGDTNNNGVVEFEEDFFPIRDNFLTATNLRADGDLDLSGFVDIRDFREWKDAWLAAGGSVESVGAALAQLSGVPEPASVLLLGLAAMTGGIRRRR